MTPVLCIWWQRLHLCLGASSSAAELNGQPHELLTSLEAVKWSGKSDLPLLRAVHRLILTFASGIVPVTCHLYRSPGHRHHQCCSDSRWSWQWIESWSLAFRSVLLPRTAQSSSLPCGHLSCLYCRMLSETNDDRSKILKYWCPRFAWSVISDKT